MSNPTDVYLGAQLRALRRGRGLTLQQLAEALGVSFQQIQKYENGTNRIAGSRLWELALLLSVPVDVFFEGLPGAGAGGRPQMDPADRKWREALELAHQVAAIDNANLRKDLIGLVKQVARLDVKV